MSKEIKSFLKYHLKFWSLKWAVTLFKSLKLLRNPAVTPTTYQLYVLIPSVQFLPSPRLLCVQVWKSSSLSVQRQTHNIHSILYNTYTNRYLDHTHTHRTILQCPDNLTPSKSFLGGSRWSALITHSVHFSMFVCEWSRHYLPEDGLSEWNGCFEGVCGDVAQSIPRGIILLLYTSQGLFNARLEWFRNTSSSWLVGKHKGGETDCSYSLLHQQINCFNLRLIKGHF